VPGAGWEEYKALYSRADVHQEGPDFRAEIVAARLDGVLVFDRRLSGVRHGRSQDHRAEDGFNHYTLQLNLAGDVEIDEGRGFASLTLGEAVLLDLTSPTSLGLRFQGAHLLTASIARSLVIAVCGPKSQHGRRLSPEATEGLRAWLQEQAAASDIGSFAGADRPQLLFRLLTLLAPQGGLNPHQRRTLVQQAMLKAYVDGQLRRRDLSSSDIARACGMSRAALYRLTAPHGGVIRYLQRRRLVQLERLLAGGDRRPLRAIAEELGFADASHMVRLFGAAAGLSPGRYRALAETPASAARKRWAAWFGELR
jgi:AraC-like DNA-binding protein